MKVILMFLLSVFSTLLALYLLFLLLVWAFGERAAYPMPDSTYFDDTESIKIALPDATKLTAKITYANSAKWILYSHGNGEDIATIQELINVYARNGFNVLSYDYCGYGTSQGKATEENSCQAADEMWEYLVEFKKVSPKDITIVGFSIGSVSATHLAGGVGAQANALVLMGSLASALDSNPLMKIVPWNFLDNVARIKNVKIPTLFIHGQQDRLLNAKNSKILFENSAAAKKRLELLPDLGHNNLPMDARTVNILLNFIKIDAQCPEF